MHCSMLAEDAIKSAIKDYRSKSRSVRPTIGPAASKVEVRQPEVLGMA